MTYDEIQEELRSLSEKLSSNDNINEEELNQIEARVAELETEKNSLIAAAEKRNNTLEKIKRGVIGNPLYENKEEKKMENEERNILESAEFRSAYLKNLQGRKLSEEEERALTSAAASAGAAVPTITQNLIIEKLYDEAPLLKEIELLNVNGNVTFAVEGTINNASVHTENGSQTDAADTLIPVSLSIYEVTKYITISKTVSKMSIDAFERWLTNMLAKRIARKITDLIINGTGTNEATGVNAANTWGATNSVTVAKAASLSKANVLAVTALLPGGYDRNAKWLMSKKTLLGDFRPLQDKGTDDLFVKENGKYYVEGYEVMLDDNVTEHEAFLGDFKMYVGNLAEEVTVDTDKKLSTNSYEYLGCAMFDGKPAIGDAFVKVVKATN